MRRPIHTSKLRDDESGTALVEFALVLPLLLVVLFGVLDFGRALNYWIDTTHLANQGARFAAVNKNPGGSTLQDYIRQQATTSELLNGGTSSVPGGLQVGVCFPSGSSDVGEPVRVTVASEYHWLPFLKIGATSTTIRGSATMRLEARPTNYVANGCP